jgi:hypothetical protein
VIIFIFFGYGVYVNYNRLNRLYFDIEDIKKEIKGLKNE